jgi:Uri superfamily endonuclease
VLEIAVPDITRLRIGSLGMLAFEAGVYAYVGSAANGIVRRVSRHLRRDKNLRWHIDYLLEHSRITCVHVIESDAPREMECRIAGYLSRRNGHIRGFGCSDCRCASHLFRMDDSRDATDGIASSLDGLGFTESACAREYEPLTLTGTDVKRYTKQ